MNSLRSTVQRASRVANASAQKRQMGTHAAPEWTGIDKVVRGVFPEDYQLAGAIIGGYAAIITLASLKPSKKAEPVAEKPASSASTGAIPSVDAPEFAEFIENEDNLNKWIDSAE